MSLDNIRSEVESILTDEDIEFLEEYFKQFKKQKDVREYYEMKREDKRFDKLKKYILLNGIIKYGDYKCIFDNKNMDIKKIHVTNKHGHMIQLDRILEMKSHAILICATLVKEQQPVIVKYYHKGERNVDEENYYYAKLRNLGVDLPWCSTTFTMFGQPILVLEKLEPLTASDNEYQMGFDILQQLKTLHTFTCHSDLKLGNVMKISGTNKYTVIDFGGCPREKYKKGHKQGWIRRCHTPLVTSQKRGVHGQVMTQWHDLIELCYTMKMIQNLRDPKTACQKDATNDYVRNGFTGKLKSCVDYIQSLNKYNIQPEHYEQFAKIMIS